MSQEALFVIVPALAMGLGWGIRGQIGHERGAMIPGCMVGLCLALLSGWPAEQAVRLGAIGALGCAVGGVMTYGHTLGLIHDLRRSTTYALGIVGLMVKGGVWIGIAGAIIGMAASPVGYSAGELLLLAAALNLVAVAGIQLINRPHRPAQGVPLVFFSKRYDPKPRAEFWGGLWLALLALLAYLLFAKNDRAAICMSLCGIVGGAAGFSLGEVFQQQGNWRKVLGAKAQPWIDWWKVMEVTFGTVAGLSLGIGWLIAFKDLPAPSMKTTVSPGVELAGLAVWLAAMLIGFSGSLKAEIVWELPFLALIIPLPCAFCGSIWPAFVILPLLTLASSWEVFREAHRPEGLISKTTMWLLILLVVLPTAFIGRRLWLGGTGARTWLYAVLGIQMACSVAKSYLVKRVFQPSESLVKRFGGLARLFAAGSALPVEIVFLVMIFILVLLT